MTNTLTNNTTIKAEARYLDGTSMGFITIENKEANIYLDIKVWNYETRTNWGHKCEIRGHLGDNYCKKNDFKIIYYNRTWESYRFQSMLRKAFYECGINKGVDADQFKELWQMLDNECSKARF